MAVQGSQAAELFDFAGLERGNRFEREKGSSEEMSQELRVQLVKAALDWQRLYGVAPAITSALSEYDAALLVGCSLNEYCAESEVKTAVSKGHDFIFQGRKYQVKANRPSGKRGSIVTLVSKASNFEWDRLIWILYDTQYELQEAWLWEVAEYRARFEAQKHVRPKDMRDGFRLRGI